jgi:hypothetical protein
VDRALVSTVEDDKKKTYRGADRVTVLGLVCEKMTERVVCARQEEEDRRVRQEVRNGPQEELGDGEGMVDDDCFSDDREVWEVTHVREEDVERTEGEGVDFLAELLELSGWTLVDDDETDPELP